MNKAEAKQKVDIFIEIEDRMKVYEVELNGRQYGMLEKMLGVWASQLSRNQLIRGYDLFYEMLHFICSPVTDGWSTFEIVLQESDEQLDFLRFMTKQVFPNDENYFVRQIGKSFACREDFAFKINLVF